MNALTPARASIVTPTSAASGLAPNLMPATCPAGEASQPLEERAREAEGFRRLAESEDAHSIGCERRGDEGMARVHASNAVYHRALARGLERLPEPLAQGTGGEVAVVRDKWDSRGIGLKNTLERPETTSATASSSRMRQAEALGVDVLTQALDAASTIEAKNSIERMAAHQMAAAHATAMKMISRGLGLLERADMNQSNAQHFQMLNVEGARLISLAARLMGAYQSGHASIVKLRQGGRQEVKVVHQYVQVTDGGQAVVAGEVVPTGGLAGKGEAS